MAAMGWYVPRRTELAPAAFVVCSWTARPTGRHRLVPDGCSDLVVVDGSDWWLCGPERRWWSFELPASTTAVGVRFRPGVLRALFDVDVAAIADRRVALADVVGADAVAASVAIATAARSQAARVTVVERFVAAQARDRFPDPLIDGVVGAVVADAWRSVAALAADLGVSPRALHRAAQRHLGYGVATLARIVRFQRFAAQAEAWRDERPTIARTAAAAGYADQAHLSRDCRAITGLPPGRFLAEYFPTFPDMSDPYKTGERFVTIV